MLSLKRLSFSRSRRFEERRTAKQHGTAALSDQSADTYVRYLSTFAEVLPDPAGAVWIRPVDYNQAVKGSAHEKLATAADYRRQSEREALVEQRVSKQTLF